MPASAKWWIIWRPGPTGKFQGTIVQAAVKPVLGPGVIAVDGPYATKAQADAFLGLAQGKPVTTPKQAATPSPGSIRDFLSRLSQASTWIRVTEVLLGLALIIVGVAKLASGTAAGKAALTAGKAAAIL